jgi:cytidine deaminase
MYIAITATLYVTLMATLWYFTVYPFKRKFKVGQIVWRKNAGHWVLAAIIENEDNPYITCVEQIQPLVVSMGHTKINSIVQRCNLRPIRWWQHNYVDPIVAKHYLLNGM